MKPQHERELEKLIGQELRQLPDLPAPGSLVHRVMLAVHKRETLPWYRRAWPTWPHGLQIVTIMLLAVLAGALMAVTIYPGWIPGWDSLGQGVKEWVGPAGQVFAQAEALLRAVFITVKALGRELLVFSLILAGAGYLGLVGLLTACYRVAAKRIF